MRIRKLKSGVKICAEIKLDSPLDAHNGIATYLATDVQSGNILVHMIPEADETGLQTLEHICQFYKDELHLETRCGIYDEFLYFSEPFPLGEYMFEWLERRERVTLTEAIKLVLSQLKVLNKAHHSKIFHGRLTPKSVLLERSTEDYALRMMGLGVSMAMPQSTRCDIDWFDYTFDLSGLSPASIDIYGMGIILLGLICGEQGIDSFEATGEIPEPLRCGEHLQMALERALALRSDAYTDILYFSQDLEAALLELDSQQGEVYVADLVGFQSAVNTVVTAAGASPAKEQSGEWDAIVSSLDMEVRSSLLCSLTSLTAIRDDEDEDVTHVTSLPEAVQNLNRIRHRDGQDEKSGRSQAPAGIPKFTPAPSSSADESEETPQDIDALLNVNDDGSFHEDAEDDCPTRIMMRPNYSSVSFTKVPTVNSAIQALLDSEIEPAKPTEEQLHDQMLKRIRTASLGESNFSLKHDFYYTEAECEAECPEESEEMHDIQETAGENASQDHHAQDPHSRHDSSQHRSVSASHSPASQPSPQTKRPLSSGTITQKQKYILAVLLLIVLILLLSIMLVAVLGRISSGNG